MTPFDAAMVAVVVAGLVWGAWKGVTWQLASLASLVLGYLVAHPLSAQLAPQFPGPPVVARAVAMLVVYALVSGGVFFVAWLIRATLRKLKFEAFDHHLGMVLGGLEGFLLGVVVTMFVVSLAPATRAPIFGSRAGQVVGWTLDAVGPVLPTEIRTALTPHWSSATPPAVTADSGPQPVAPPAFETGAPRDEPTVRTFLDQAEAKVEHAVIEEAKKDLSLPEPKDPNGGAVDRR